MIEKILKYTEEFIASNSTEDNQKLQRILRLANLSEKDQKAFDEEILKKASINIHFHPDRYANNQMTIDNLIESGEYKSQFQTKTSSGSLTAKIGGDRDNWENKLFNNLYGTNIEERPKYGSLNLTYTSDGASPRFGSCFFVTHPKIKLRSTFTYGDSYLLPKERGTAKNLTQIYACLFDDIFEKNNALGFSYQSIGSFINQTTSLLKSKILNHKLSHNLDAYIETQIHGKIDLKEDLVSLVVDYSFKGTELENKFKILRDKYGISLIWNLGYQLEAIEIPDHFRGVPTRIFANKIAENGIVNAYILGKVLNNKTIELEYDRTDILQLSKYVWHCLVKFGKRIKPESSTK